MSEKQEDKLTGANTSNDGNGQADQEIPPYGKAGSEFYKKRGTTRGGEWTQEGRKVESEPPRPDRSAGEPSEQDKEIAIDGLIKELGDVKCINRQLHIYSDDSGLWEYHSKDELEHIIQPVLAKMGLHATKSIEDYAGRIMRRCWVNSEKPEGILFHGVYYDARNDLNVIHTPNVVVIINMKTGECETRKHSPELAFCEGIATSYDIAAACPKWDEQMLQRQPEAEDQELLDFFGWLCFIGHNKHESTALINLGDPDTGKSTYSDILIAMIGEHLVSDLSLQQMCPPPWQEKTHLPQLNGKLLNVCAEASDAEIKHSESLKRIASGESQSSRESYGRNTKVQGNVKTLTNANTMPNIYSGMATMKRLRVADWRHRIEDPDLNFREALQEETPGILQRLLRQSQKFVKFSRAPFGSRASQEKYNELCKRADPWWYWFNEYFVGKIDGWTQEKIVHDSIREFWHKNHLTTSFKGDIEAWMKRVGPRFGIYECFPRLGKKRIHAYRGLWPKGLTQDEADEERYGFVDLRHV